MDRIDNLRKKRIGDGTFVDLSLQRPGGKRMRGDDYGSNGLSDNQLLYDASEDSYVWPKVVIREESERVAEFKKRMGWDQREIQPGRRAQFTKARSKDIRTIITGCVFHYIGHDLAIGRNARGSDVQYNYKTGKMTFTPSVNRGKKILEAVNVRGVPTVSRQTGIPVDVLRKWKNQGHCGGVLREA